MPGSLPIRLRRRGGWKLLVAGAALVAALALADEGVRRLMRLRAAPGGGAAWIWTPDAEAGRGPVGFVAVRDFEIARPPAEARLLVLGDEGWQLFLNRTLVGVGDYRDGDRLAEFAVGPLLLPGLNRILVQAQSGRGAGGLLVALEGAGLEVGTGADWQITRVFRLGLLEPGAELPAARPPRLLGAPPLGRWGRPAVGPRLPLFDNSLLEPRPRLPRRVRAEGAERWHVLRKLDWSVEPIGYRALFDWGEEVTALPHLVFAHTREARALYWTGSRPPRPDREAPDGWVLKLEGLRAWSGCRPQRFRYLAVRATEPLLGARAYLLDPAAPGVRVAAAGSDRGAFGLEPLPLRSPAEDEIGRELESLAGLVGGEGL